MITNKTLFQYLSRPYALLGELGYYYRYFVILNYYHEIAECTAVCCLIILICYLGENVHHATATGKFLITVKKTCCRVIEYKIKFVNDFLNIKTGF